MSDCTNGRIERMLKRNHFKVGDILYLTHEGQRTLLHLQDRRVIPTPVPMKTEEVDIYMKPVLEAAVTGDFSGIRTH